MRVPRPDRGAVTSGAFPIPPQASLDEAGRLLHEDDPAAQLALGLAGIEACLADLGLGPDDLTSLRVTTVDHHRIGPVLDVLTERLAQTGARPLLTVHEVERLSPHGLLVLLDGSSGAQVVRVARQRGDADDEEGRTRSLSRDVKYSTSVVQRVVDTDAPLKTTLQKDGEDLDLGNSVFDLKLRAVMCVPLADLEAGEGSRPTGVLYVDSRAASRQFSQRDLSLFAALAQHISVALENAKLHLDRMEKVRLEQTLELAAEIQEKLMPGVPEDIPHYEFHGWYGPAEVAAGDFYDFLRTKDGCVGVVVGDVTGHGIGPALITATAQGSLASYMRVLQDPGQAVTHLNEDISAKVEDGRFITMFLASLTPDGELHGVNAGHAPPMIWRKESGDVETITGGGPALGMIDDEVYTTLEPRHLGEGDVLVVYTDGLTEAREPGSGTAADENVNMFGEDGLERALCDAAGRGLDAKGIALHLVETALELAGGEREDDITVVVARRV